MKKLQIFNKYKLFGLLLLLPLFVAISQNFVVKAGANPPIQPPGLEIAISVLEENTPILMNNPDVIGTAIGLDKNGEPVVKVFSLAKQTKGIPRILNGIPVNIEVTGMFVANSDPTARFPRPVPIGVSSGHPDITAGTIGCRATDGNVLYALSNNHVYANSNDANISDNVLQPGSFDGGNDPADTIGTLFDFEVIAFDGSNNFIDAAIALSSESDLSNATPSDDGYGIPSSAQLQANLGMNVKKYGRTTGLTYGEVTGLNATVDVCYECSGPFCFGCKKLARFVDQIIIEPGSFSSGGDSGSVIVTDDSNNDPVGLLFAGSSSHTIANKIQYVFDRFGVNCDDGSTFSCSADSDCDDGNACTVDSCDTGTCNYDSISDCCGNGVCELNESQCGCSEDCGTPSSSENNCIDGVDNDCDGFTDENDSDCSVSSCLQVGDLCDNDDQCCSGKCRGKPGAKTCK